MAEPIKTSEINNNAEVKKDIFYKNKKVEDEKAILPLHIVLDRSSDVLDLNVLAADGYIIVPSADTGKTTIVGKYIEPKEDTSDSDIFLFNKDKKKK